MKPPSSCHRNGENIILRRSRSRFEHEAELVVVIGKRGRNVTARNEGLYLRLHCGNDVTRRDAKQMQ